MTQTLLSRRLDQARAVIDEVVAPAAVTVDTDGVPASHLEALAAAGYLGLGVPEQYGGTPAAPGHDRELDQLLAGACPSSHLVVSQHAGAVRSILDAPPGQARDLLALLATGELIGGAAFGHVRSWPRRTALVAKRVAGGWRLDGTVPWLSGWGLVTLLHLGAVAEAERRMVFAVVDLPDERVVATDLDLAAVGGSRTVTLRVDDLFVPDARVLATPTIEEWHDRDGATGPAVAPGTIGLARAAVSEALAAYPGEPSLLALAGAVEELDRVDRSTPLDSHAIESREQWRAYSIDLACRATRAGVVAAGGAGLGTSHIAQVRARAALFLHVRSLTAGLRQHHFAHLAGAPTDPPDLGPHTQPRGSTMIITTRLDSSEPASRAVGQ